MAKPIKVLRWTLTMAASEIPTIARETLAKRLKALDIRPGEDGMFSTGQILRAWFGDIEGERLRKTKEEADKLEIENAKTRGELVELEGVKKTWQEIVLSARQQLLNIPVKVESQFHVGMSQAELRKLLEQEVDFALNELSGKN